MTPWQRELERRTWANKHRKRRRRWHFYTTRYDDGGRADIIKRMGLVEVAYLYVKGTQET